MGKGDDDPPDSGKEWKSSHDRFVEMLERYGKKLEEQQAKSDKTANGFYIEISRKELRDHLDARALHYTEEAFKLTESGLQVPTEYRLSDGSIIESVRIAAERTHEQTIEALHGKAKAFAFSAKHLPEGKEIFIMDLAMCANLELIPMV